MGIPNESVMQNEIAEEKREEDEALKRRRLEQSLEQDIRDLENRLEETIPASEPPQGTSTSGSRAGAADDHLDCRDQSQ